MVLVTTRMAKHLLDNANGPQNQSQLLNASTMPNKDRPKFTLKAAAMPTTTLHIENLPGGVTVRVLFEVFRKYGNLVDIHPCKGRGGSGSLPDGGISLADACKKQWKVCGRLEHCHHDINVFTSLSGLEPMADDSTAGGSTISPKDGMH